MSKRPILDKNLDSTIFKQYYFLKKELIDFCKKNNIQTSGGKIDLTNRVFCFLETGKIIPSISQKKKPVLVENITLETIIETNFVCSEKHRSFYKEQIGKSFSFNVIFQKWLKNNFGKTYKDSIEAYYKILEDKKNSKSPIDCQFEYNTYIRDFFEENKDKKLTDAIKCWKYKKEINGHNKYEKEDLQIL